MVQGRAARPSQQRRLRRAAQSVVGSRVRVVEDPAEILAGINSEDWAAETLYEDDLVLGDLDSDDEVPSPEPSYPSGRMAARRRMQAAPLAATPTWMGIDSAVSVAQRCRSLVFSLSQFYRASIHVPDVWTVDVELPAAWLWKVLTPTSENSAGAAEFSWVSLGPRQGVFNLKKHGPITQARTAQHPLTTAQTRRKMDIFAHSRQFTGGDPDMLKAGYDMQVLGMSSRATLGIWRKSNGTLRIW
ncbi:hypothetical protein AK812_SmicGene7923 [Symbiodinium microadriaticum]|uniref:Uncharacterized protein n=1 Tax=Symbiodinium microadriaticum TaxID=2951 RepID=A0A1Q9EMC5_SYMMI|nr:hypothetical protein AK812_SmicGene7923 [Symbiodinium microadriaticum]